VVQLASAPRRNGTRRAWFDSPTASLVAVTSHHNLDNHGRANGRTVCKHCLLLFPYISTMRRRPPSDSQAIQEMLEINSSPAKSINESFIRSPNPNDPTLDSFSSGKPTNSLPQYHFHGLASTQTQSQVFDDIEMDEGSQKENLVSVNSHDSAQSSGPQPPHPSAPTTTVLAKVTRATSQASSAKVSVNSSDFPGTLTSYQGYPAKTSGNGFFSIPRSKSICQESNWPTDWPL